MGGERLAALTGLSPAVLNAILAGLIRGEVQPPVADNPYRERVLRAFLNNGRLIRIPAQRKKRGVILRELAALFGPGRTCSEREVNALLAGW